MARMAPRISIPYSESLASLRFYYFENLSENLVLWTLYIRRSIALINSETGLLHDGKFVRFNGNFRRLRSSTELSGYLAECVNAQITVVPSDFSEDPNRIHSEPLGFILEHDKIYGGY